MNTDKTAAAPGRPKQGLAPSGGSAAREAASVGVHLVVMGVAGCGKSVVGKKVATALSLPFIEGDAFHPPTNVAKMRDGAPLTDADRAQWLADLGLQLQAHPAGAVLACSALKRAYREQLRAALPALRFVHLAISQDESLRRVSNRPGHFYPPSLVASQFEALQDPAGEPGVSVLDGALALDVLATQAVRACVGS